MSIQRSWWTKQTSLNFTTSQTKCKRLSLSETKYFWKDNLKRIVPVLRSSREILYRTGT